jgi:hypothetical protein
MLKKIRILFRKSLKKQTKEKSPVENESRISGMPVPSLCPYNDSTSI